MKRIALLLTLTYQLLAPASPQYYVAQSGSDSAPGTLAAPFKTLAYALSKLNPGDTLNIRAGTWSEHIDSREIKIPSGTATAPITIQAYQNEVVTFMANGRQAVILLDMPAWTIWKSLILDTRDGYVWDGPLHGVSGIIVDYPYPGAEHDNRFENLELIGSGNTRIRGVGIVGGHHDAFIGLKVHDFSEHGIYLNHSGNTVDGVDVFNNGRVGGSVNTLSQPGHGLQIYASGDNPTDNTVRNSKFHGNLLGGIQVHGDRSLIYNNLVYDNGGPGIENYAFSATIVFNTVLRNGESGIAAVTGQSVAMIRNNILSGNKSGDRVQVGPNVANLTNDHNQEGITQSFVAQGIADFHVVAGSPAIGAGIPVAGLTLDRDGKLRSATTPTIGAYEFGGTIPPIVVIPPTVNPNQAAIDSINALLKQLQTLLDTIK